MNEPTIARVTVQGRDVTGQTGSSRLIRTINERAALGCLFLRGPLTRPQLVELTGFSKPTASEVIRRLTAVGLVTVIGRTAGGPGPRADVYAINPQAGFAAAVSIREPDGLDVIVGDLGGEVRTRRRSTVSFDGSDPAPIVHRAVAAAFAEAEVPLERLRHLWIGLPGSYDDSRDITRNIDIPGFDREGIAERMSKLIDATIHIDNDVNLATLAERHHGRGGDRGFVLLWLGERGIGLGIDLGGALLRGTRGAAGEVGYLPVGRPGEIDRMLQDLVGGPALVELSAQHGRPAASAREAMLAALESRDERFLTTVANRMVPGLTAVVSVIDPAVVVLAGEVGIAGGQALCDAVSRSLSGTAFDTPMTVSGVESDAVLRGGLAAAQAALRESLLVDPTGG